MRLFLVVALCVWASSGAAQPSGNSASGQPSANQTTNVATERPRVILPRNRQIDQSKEAQPQQSDPYAKERNEREKRDIVAQERAARWAKASFWAIVAQTLLALGALTALVLDLRQNRISTERQLRAYVLLDTAQVHRCATLEGATWESDHPEARYVAVEVKNFGATPAYKVVFKMGVAIRPFPLREAFAPIPEDVLFSVADLAQGRERIMVLEVLNSGPMHETMRQGGWGIYAFGFVEYQDIFGRKHTTNLQVVCQGQGYMQGRMTETADANESD